MNFSIRLATKEDAARLLEIVNALPKHFTKEALNDIQVDLESEDIITFLVEQDGIIFGFLSYELRSELTILKWLAVNPSIHGKGIGTALMNYFLHEVKIKGAKAIEIAVIASSVNFPPYEKTRKFYEKFGFKEIRIDKDYYAPGDDRGIMRLELTD